MAKSAATRALRRGSVTAVRSVGDIFPLAIAKLFIVDAEALFLPHHEYCGQGGRYETSVVVEDRFAVGVLLHGIALEKDDRSIGKVERLSGRHRGGYAVAPHRPDLPILEVVTGLE